MPSRSFAWLLLPLALIVGCHFRPRGGPTTTTVTGVVTLDGKPLPNAVISFVAVEGEYSVAATSGASGRYLVRPAQGRNTITVSKFVGGSLDDPSEGLEQGQLEAAADEEQPELGITASGPTQLLPGRYSEFAATELEMDVPEKQAEFDLKLLSEQPPAQSP